MRRLALGPSTRRSRRWCAIRAQVTATWLALICLCTLGCGVEAADIDPLPIAVDCACADGLCPVDVCAMSIKVDLETCKGEVDAVEVMVGDTLESVILAPGQSLVSCATFARGSTAVMRARADRVWAWEELIDCPAAAAGEASGQIIDRVLHCTSSG
jgi:hypothetical protein